MPRAMEAVSKTFICHVHIEPEPCLSFHKVANTDNSLCLLGDEFAPLEDGAIPVPTVEVVEAVKRRRDELADECQGDASELKKLEKEAKKLAQNIKVKETITTLRREAFTATSRLAAANAALLAVGGRKKHKRSRNDTPPSRNPTTSPKAKAILSKYKPSGRGLLKTPTKDFDDSSSTSSQDTPEPKKTRRSPEKLCGNGEGFKAPGSRKQLNLEPPNDARPTTSTDSSQGDDLDQVDQSLKTPGPKTTAATNKQYAVPVKEKGEGLNKIPVEETAEGLKKKAPVKQTGEGLKKVTVKENAEGGKKVPVKENAEGLNKAKFAKKAKPAAKTSKGPTQKDDMISNLPVHLRAEMTPKKTSTPKPQKKAAENTLEMMLGENSASNVPPGLASGDEEAGSNPEELDGLIEPEVVLTEGKTNMSAQDSPKDTESDHEHNLSGIDNLSDISDTTVRKSQGTEKMTAGSSKMPEASLSQDIIVNSQPGPSQGVGYQSWDVDAQIQALRDHQQKKPKSQRDQSSHKPAIPNDDVKSLFGGSTCSRASKSGKKRALVQTADLDNFFTEIRDRVEGPQFTDESSKYEVDAVMDMYTRMDATKVRKQYFCEDSKISDQLLKITDHAEYVKILFVSVEADSGLVNVFLLPNIHQVFGIDENWGISKKNKNLRDYLYDSKLIKVCRDPTKCKADLKKLILPPPDLAEAAFNFISCGHFIRQLPQLSSMEGMLPRDKVEKMTMYLERSFGKGIPTGLRREMDARKREKDLPYQHKFMRKTPEGAVQIQTFAHNTFGEPSQGHDIDVEDGGRIVWCQRVFGKNVKRDARNRLGEDIVHVPHRLLWVCFADEPHDEVARACDLLLDHPLRMAKIMIYYVLCTMKNSDKDDGVNIDNLIKWVSDAGEGVRQDIKKGFKKDPTETTRFKENTKDSTENMELTIGQVLGPRMKASAWMATESVDPQGENCYDKPIFAHDLQSLSSGMTVKSSVVDLYISLCREWHRRHEDIDIDAGRQSVNLGLMNQVFEAFKGYADLRKEEKARALKLPKLRFQRPFDELKLTEWILPVEINVPGEMCQTNEDTAVVVCVFAQFRGFPKETTKELESQVSSP